MPCLGLQLKCHQIINQINDDTLNNNILQILNGLGGIRELLLKNLNNIASDNFVNILKNIKQNQDNNDDINNDDRIVLTSLPKEMILKTSQYLGITDVKELGSTCIELALSLKSEINKIDIRIITYDDLVLNDALIFEQNQFDEFGKNYRVRTTKTLRSCIEQYNLVNTRSRYGIAFWNLKTNYNNRLYPVNSMANYYHATLKRILSETGQLYPKFVVMEDQKCTRIIKSNGNTMIIVKYFDIVYQKLQTIDVIITDAYKSITYDVLTNYIKNNLINTIFKPINEYKDTLTNPFIFKFYQQIGFKPTDIEEIILNGKPLSSHVLIFELNICYNDIMTRFQNSIPIWHQKFKKQGKPFCMNFKIFWTYHYSIYIAKKELNIL